MVTVKLLRSGKNKTLYYLFGIVVLVSFGLAIVGEFDTMFAWWLAIGLLLPPLLWAFKTPYVALKTICGISFLTQFVTLPFFYVYRDDFKWGHIKPFHFTTWESFPMLAKVSLFLFALVLFFKWLYPVIIVAGGSSRKLTNVNHQAAVTKDLLNKSSGLHVRHNRKTWLFTLLIVLLIAILTPLVLWTYSQGISLVGVEPPKLPYRLSGILYYLIKYLSPLLLGYLYYKTKGSWPLMLLFLAYAFLLGLCTVSKSSVMIIMMPVLGLAWIEKRKFFFAVAGIGTTIGIQFAAAARVYVYIVIGGKSAADTSLSIFTIIYNIFTDPDSKMFNFNYLLKLVSQIISRIEGFSNLVMSQYYDPDAVVGAWGFILRIIWRGFADFDTNTKNLHSIQWQGDVLPVGFYNGGALLSSIVILGNAGLLWVLLIAMVVAIILATLEKSSNNIGRQYEEFRILKVPVIIFLSLIFFTEAGGAIIFVYPFLLLLIVSFFPTIVLKNRRGLKARNNVSPTFSPISINQTRKTP
jgi:hypothetical protein